MVPFAHRLRSDTPLVATFSLIASVEIVQLIAQAGFDVVILDMEHGPLDSSTLNTLIPAARAAGIASIVRVRTNESSLIAAALDVGADGVLVPQVASGADAAAAVQAARFAPLGMRGVNPFTRAAGYVGKTDWFTRANDEIAVLVMVEGLAGVAALPEIMATPGIDGIFVGPFDLSQSLGVPGQIEHPEVVARIESIVAQAKARNLATAVFAPRAELANRWLGLGVRLVALGYDTAHVFSGLRAARSGISATG
jgi:4-hydroxy-2-oxoheptanedioate aldolase